MTAAAAAAAVDDVEGFVEVMGATPLAEAVRRLLGPRLLPGDSAERPAAVIETSGEPAAMAAALRRVDDLGVVVLAGPAPADRVALDLYADLHVRGLVLVGLPHADDD